MRKVVNSFFALTLLLCISCARKVTLPIKTSLGDLVRIENRDTVTTNKETISPKSDEVIYVLSFEGKGEIEFKDVAAPDMFGLLAFPLVDSNGKEFGPVFFGSPTKEGVLSNEDIRFNGGLTGKDGKDWVTTGRISLPESKLTVVYTVPKNASLTLKDGGQQHPIN